MSDAIDNLTFIMERQFRLPLASLQQGYGGTLDQLAAHLQKPAG